MYSQPFQVQVEAYDKSISEVQASLTMKIAEVGAAQRSLVLLQRSFDSLQAEYRAALGRENDATRQLDSANERLAGTEAAHASLSRAFDKYGYISNCCLLALLTLAAIAARFVAREA